MARRQARQESAHRLFGGGGQIIATVRHRLLQAHWSRTQAEYRVDTPLVQGFETATNAASDGNTGYAERASTFRHAGRSLAERGLKIDLTLGGERQIRATQSFVQADQIQHQIDAASQLGVQESLPHQVAWLAGALTAYSHLGVGRDENGTGESTTLFYRTNRFELQSSGMFWLSETPDQLSKGWDAAIRRICTWAVLKDKSTGKPVLVMNTHFDHVGVEARKQSASLLVTKSRELNKGQWPVILLGDFNSTPDSEAVKTLQSAFTDARLAAKSRTLPQEGSFNAFDSTKPATQLIDHIFVWGGLDTERFVMLVESRERRYPSDHFPVVAELQLKPSPR